MGDRETPPNEFERAAATGEGAESSLLVELWDFLKHNKKWWLLPIVAVLLMLGVLIILSGTAASPFTYTLF